MLAEARIAAQSAQAALESGRALEAQLREQAIRAEDQSAQLAALAKLALLHLGDHCPVCTQLHDRATTVAHLEALIAGAAAPPITEASPRPDIDLLISQMSERTQRVQQLEMEIQQWRAQEHAREAAFAQRAQRLDSLGIAGDAPAEGPLRDLIRSIQQRQQESAKLQEDGETLALALARSGEVARRAELDKERGALADTVAVETAALAARRESGDLAVKILESLRDAAARLVDAQLTQIAPLVERVYARIDPHPAFRKVQLTSRFEQSRGRVRTTVADMLTDVVVKHPETVLSSSQVNALAVSIFLALNLGVPARPLDAVLLDDPLQSLDDVNLLGLVDLLRRTKQQRQLIISTHDVRFAGLLERKLRPDEDGKTMVIELSGWRRDGPRVSQRQVLVEPRQLRLVS
jgi:outer membrane murein-binding lipoprotein Lpp